MSNIQTGAERMPHDLSHLGFLAGQIGRLITISTTPVIAGDSFKMDAVGALRLSPLRRGLDRKSGSAGMPRPISYAVFCLKKKKKQEQGAYSKWTSPNEYEIIQASSLIDRLRNPTPLRFESTALM